MSFAYATPVHANPLTPHIIGPKANIPPLVTPLRNGSIDHPSLERLIRHVVDVGQRHIFVMGETGEFRTLGNKLRLECCRSAIQLADGQATVFVNATAETFDQTLSNGEILARAGAPAVVIAPMWGTNDALFTYLAKHSLGYPLIVYNNPHITGKRNIPFDALEAIGPAVSMLKDSSGDPAVMQRYLEIGKRFGFQVYQGDEMQIGQRHPLTDSSLCVAGSVASIGNLNGSATRFFSGELTTRSGVNEWQERVNECVRLYTLDRTQIKGGLKFLLARRGVLASDESSDPSATVSRDQRAHLENALQTKADLLWGL